MQIEFINYRQVEIKDGQYKIILNTRYLENTRWFISSIQEEGNRRLNRYAMSFQPKVALIGSDPDSAIWVGGIHGNEHLLSAQWRADEEEICLVQSSILIHPELATLTEMGTWATVSEKLQWTPGNFNYTLRVLSVRDMLWRDGYYTGYAWRSQFGPGKEGDGITSFEVSQSGSPPEHIHHMTRDSTSLYLNHPARFDCVRTIFESDQEIACMREGEAMAQTMDFANLDEDGAFYWAPEAKRNAHGDGWMVKAGHFADLSFNFTRGS